MRNEKQICCEFRYFHHVPGATDPQVAAARGGGRVTRTGHTAESQHQFRYIEWKEVKIYDFQKVTFSTLFKLYIAGLGVLIPKRYHMLG